MLLQDDLLTLYSANIPLCHFVANILTGPHDLTPSEVIFQVSPASRFLSSPQYLAIDSNESQVHVAQNNFLGRLFSVVCSGSSFSRRCQAKVDALPEDIITELQA